MFSHTAKKLLTKNFCLKLLAKRRYACNSVISGTHYSGIIVKEIQKT